MTDAGSSLPQAQRVLVGGLAHKELIARLDGAGVLLNAHAETLLAAATASGTSDPEAILVEQRSVRELGLPEGGTLPAIYEHAKAEGLRLCPPITAAYLRLAIQDQASAPDSVLSAGRAPSGSLTVAAPRLRDDDDFPAGFYLRVIDGQPWLRGYRCDDQHVWSADDEFVFRAADETYRNSVPEPIAPQRGLDTEHGYGRRSLG